MYERTKSGLFVPKHFREWIVPPRFPSREYQRKTYRERHPLPAPRLYTIAQTQVNSNYFASSPTVTFSTGHTAGNLLVLMNSGDCVGGTGQLIVSVSDTEVNSFIVPGTAASTDNASGAVSLAYCLNLKGGSASNTITVVLNTLSFHGFLVVAEYSATGMSFDLAKAVTFNTNQTNPTTGNISTSGLDLVVCYMSAATPNGVASAGTPFTIRQNLNNIDTEDFTQSASGAIAGNFNVSSGGQECSIGVASFKPSGGGGASPLRQNSSLNGLGASGPFFHNPLG